MKKLLWAFIVAGLLLPSMAAAQFVLEYPDGELQISGRIRPAFAYRFYQEGDYNHKKNRFYVHQARIKLEGEMFDVFEYELQIEVRGYDDGEIGKDLYLEYKPVSTFMIRAGQFKVPYSRTRMVSTSKLAFTTRPAVADEFVPGRDRGVMVRFRTSDRKYVLYAGAFAGNGDNTKNDDRLGRPLYAVRVEAAPLGKIPKTEGDIEMTPSPRFLVGLNVAYSDDAEPTEEDYPRTICGRKNLFGGDFTFKYSGFYFKFEANFAKLHSFESLEPPTLGANSYYAGGFLVAASYYIPSLKIEPVIQYDQFDPMTHKLGSYSNSVQRTITFGMNYLPFGHDFKIMANYFKRLPYPGGDHQWKEDELRIIAQLMIG